jgi:hypothetical protein
VTRINIKLKMTILRNLVQYYSDFILVVKIIEYDTEYFNDIALTYPINKIRKYHHAVFNGRHTIDVL